MSRATYVWNKSNGEFGVRTTRFGKRWEVSITEAPLWNPPHSDRPRPTYDFRVSFGMLVVCTMPPVPIHPGAEDSFGYMC